MNSSILEPITIRTYSGIDFDINNPHVDMINIIDIAKSLSRECRFNGQTKKFYSVAEHSLLVKELVPKKYKLCALLHDASDAYLRDLSRPVKYSLHPAYRNLEKKIMLKISEKFGFEWPKPQEVSEADELAHLYEWEKNMVADKLFRTLSAEEGERQFLKAFYELSENKIYDSARIAC